MTRVPDNAPTIRLARYECRVHQSGLNPAYGTPVSVLASSAAEARERAIDLAGIRDARVVIDSIRDEPDSSEVIPVGEKCTQDDPMCEGFSPQDEASSG